MRPSFPALITIFRRKTRLGRIPEIAMLWVLLAGTPAAAALAGAQALEMGALVGHWECRSESMEDDGWRADPGSARWHWRWVIEDFMLVDHWQPGPERDGPEGATVRLYNPETGDWDVQWIVHGQAGFIPFKATIEDHRMVMRGTRPASGGMPAHQARITYHLHNPERFHWTYEVAAVSGEGEWQAFSRMRCGRLPDQD